MSKTTQTTTAEQRIETPTGTVSVEQQGDGAWLRICYPHLDDDGDVFWERERSMFGESIWLYGDLRRQVAVALCPDLADAPHQRAAEIGRLLAIEQGAFRLCRVIKTAIESGAPWRIPMAVADVAADLANTLAAPTDPRPVDPSPGSGQAPDAAGEE